jgi:uncharacterized membrane protein
MPLQSIGSRMAVAGHPLHPALIHFPVAALIGLVGTDLAFVFSGDAFWARAGVWLAGIGVLMGTLSGLVGMIDLVTVHRIRRLISGWSHAILAVMALSLASLNWLLRVDEPGAAILPWGLYLSLLTAALLGMVGFLGAQLVYEFGVGVQINEAVRRSDPS